MKKYILYLFIFDLVFCLNIFAQVTPTNEWVNFFSATTTFNEEPIPIGSVVSAYDSDGVLCGSFEVHTEGQYGFLAVYRDDSYTSGIDEGAEPGDTLTFYINNHIALILGPGNPIWTTNGDVIELNLEGYSNYVPVITGFPDSLIFRADSAITLNLNNYVEDLDDPDSSLHWTISSNDSVIVNLDDVSKVVTLSALIHWSGIESLVFTVMDDSSAWDSDTIIVQVIGIVGIKNDFVRSIPKDYSLYQNYPNPFNPTTTFKYELPKESKVVLSVFDMNGRLVETIVKQTQAAGYYSVQWDADDYSSGVYIYKIQVNDPANGGADGFSNVKKCVLMK
ncbi:MAG: T9SS type A sorting domain-containing protein [Candidatus Marinimicrobia bacterium]|nr:T9SS type A sorting domain-containing protein [Candidatus Neomarinimicrobiota bacterium]